MKKIKEFLFLVLIMVIAGGWASTLNAQKSEAYIRQMLEQRNQEIKALLGPEGTDYTQQQREKLKDIINEVIDFRAMAKYALQDTWQTLNLKEQEEFVDLFAKVVREHSLSNLDIYRATITYERIEVEGDSAVAVTLATLNRVRTPVKYKLFFEDDTQQWVVIDLYVDNVSTARSYKRQFQDIIRDKGYDYLIKTLQDRVS